RRQRARAHGDQLRNAPRDLERAMESGVNALLASLARRIDVATRPPAGPLPDSEFNRYVTHKKDGAQTPRQIVTPAPRHGAARRHDVARGQDDAGGPRVRVDDARERDDEDDEETSEKRSSKPRGARR
ncbi:MAG: hypothetical protein M3Y87_11625, partial [Myxococcota bacterium]|nr:hypothetical protein [Myxococcota bacterium]